MLNPTSRAPGSPGPEVAPIASISFQLIFATERASRITGTIARRCSLAATSGTIPSVISCKLVCEATIDESICLPSTTTDAAVSSQDDSIPNMFMPKYYFEIRMLQRNEQ